MSFLENLKEILLPQISNDVIFGQTQKIGFKCAKAIFRYRFLSATYEVANRADSFFIRTY